MTVKLAFLYNSLRTEGRSELIIKVSVIIPVYNAESFLRPCLNSVISQNYKDSEIILIENGSEDGSRTICEEYAERFENIRIITETQRGTAMARQRGLDVCKGEAVVFVDADDVLPSPDVFSKMAECLEKTKADIVCGEYSRLWENFFRQSLLKHFQIIQERVRRFGSMLFSPVEICPMYGEKCTEFLS